ncbi:hypothetical protein [Laceyella putida]|uniref:Uncharacterized protein n=1 Tax=Laceyella putida TaxID=110101 RepID=A0ABW2RHY4_9BACL
MLYNGQEALITNQIASCPFLCKEGNHFFKENGAKGKGIIKIDY